jgi:hypothetical protein
MSRLVRATVLACVAGGALVGCGSCRETRQGEGAAPSAEASVSDARADAGELAARCTGAVSEVPLEGGDSLEVGSADVGAGGLAVGVSFGRDGARLGAVVLADLGLTKVRSLALGELSAGDAAPLVASCGACGGRRFVAAHVRPEPPAKPAAAPSGAVRGTAPPRVLSISSLDGEALAPVVKVREQADESSAFDLLPGSRDGGLVAWDEDSDRVVRGIVKVATFSLGKVSEPVVVSPYETDADTPKLVRTSKGEVFVAWLAREGVGADGGLADADVAGAYLEAPGEERSHQWVEVLALDEAGRPKGGVVPVTPKTRGFASSFELVPDGDGFDVVVVDAAVQRDGALSRIVRVPVHGGKIATSSELVPFGASGGGTVVGPFVTFVDGSERTMLVSREAPFVQSREPLAQGGRFVAYAEGSLFAASIVQGDGGPARGMLRRIRCP